MTNVKKFTAKVTALLLALSLALLSVPQVSFTVFADDDLGSVRVIVENTTFTEAVSGGNRSCVDRHQGRQVGIA